MSACAGVPWKEKLERDISLFGHRNWIVVADSAYPAQGRAAIETIATGADHLDIVRHVLAAIDQAEHVRPVIYLDEELRHVRESDAPGIGDFRRQLDHLLAGRHIERVPHERLIAELDEAARTFRVLVLKSNLTLPYTSVFIRLDCGYWSAEAEEHLRRSMP